MNAKTNNINFKRVEQPIDLHLLPVAFGLGYITLTIQILVLREQMSAFQGNELTIGAMLGCWLLWGGIGSIASRKIFKSNLPHAINYIYWALCILAPLTIIGFRFCRIPWSLSTGEIAGFEHTLITSFILLAPFCFLGGAAFATTANLSRSTTLKTRGPAWIYSWEAAGGLAAAVLHRVFCASSIHALKTTWIASLILGLGIYLINPCRKRYFSLFILLCATAIIFTPVLNLIDIKMDAALRPNFELVKTLDTPYGKLQLLSRNDETSLLLNGSLIAHSAAFQTAEETAHLPMASHSNPQKILLLEGGYSGIAKEIMKHPIQSLTIVLLDPEPVKLAYQTNHLKLIDRFDDPKVTIHHQDARAFVEHTKSSAFDVIISCVPDPSSIAYNRFYTFEFFSEIRRILKADGVFFIRYRSSDNVLSPEQTRYLTIALSTLNKAFEDEYLYVIPGESADTFASKNKTIQNISSEILLNRLKNRNITSYYVSSAYLPFRFHPMKINQFKSVVEFDSDMINTDFHPRLFASYLTLWSSQFKPLLWNWLKHLRGFGHIWMIALILCYIVYILSNIAKPDMLLFLGIGSVGFAELSSEIFLVYLLQLSSGSAYLKTGLLIGAFTAGLTAGSIFISRYNNPKLQSPFYVGLIQFCLFAAIIISFLPYYFYHVSPEIFLDIMAFISGMLGGAHYTLASRMIPERAGLFYGIDLLGSALGALIISGLLLPYSGTIIVLEVLGIILILSAVPLLRFTFPWRAIK